MNSRIAPGSLDIDTRLFSLNLSYLQLICRERVCAFSKETAGLCSGAMGETQEKT
jgi:hypothetical protein